MNNKERRCVQCGKIIVGNSKIKICPRCADEDKRGAAGVATFIVVAGVAISKYGKPVIKAVKNIGEAIITR